MKLEYSLQIFDKTSNIKFHEDPSSGSRVVPCGWTDMTELTVALRNFAQAPKKHSHVRAGLLLPSQYTAATPAPLAAWVPNGGLLRTLQNTKLLRGRVVAGKHNNRDRATPVPSFVYWQPINHCRKEHRRIKCCSVEIKHGEGEKLYVYSLLCLYLRNSLLAWTK